MDLGLGGATVVVQGGTQGMGRAAADCFAGEGARVAVLARTSADVERVTRELAGLGASDTLGLVADVTRTEEVDGAFLEVAGRWGALNALVNTVGPKEGGGRFEDLTDDDWLAAVDSGALSAVRCVRAALPLLRSAEWARIVNVSAHSTKRQSESLVAYTAAKAMLTSISKNLSLTLAPDEILVNTVSPGSFTSEGLASWARSVNIDPDDPYAVMAGIADHFGHPAHLPRAGLPKEIGPVIAFLCSRGNSYMTGANVNVDGGSDFC